MQVIFNDKSYNLSREAVNLILESHGITDTTGCSESYPDGWVLYKGENGFELKVKEKTSHLLSFSMTCVATYPTEIILPESFFDGNVCIVDKTTIKEYILDHLDQCKILGNLEWLNDAYDMFSEDDFHLSNIDQI